ncbi:hypothetical protein AWZ03_003618 [Drosophila navojoa]|uniref:Uncharacterized protein n=1 Tax=Drosophila navojoa TaxID=7232 RepID=A0A484BMY4_DRONA|nr:hypothetical protein AWZ03_003618 [Drosophila navojoa]
MSYSPCLDWTGRSATERQLQLDVAVLSANFVRNENNIAHLLAEHLQQQQEQQKQEQQQQEQQKQEQQQPFAMRFV